MKNYNAKHVVVTVGGVPLAGMGEDGFVKVTPKTPTFSTKVGADGLVVRSQSADERVDIEITLLAASPSNAVLQSFHTVDRASGVAVVPVAVMDLHGRVVSTIPQAWIVQEPDLEHAKEDGQVTWVLEGVKAETQFSGSTI